MVKIEYTAKYYKNRQKLRIEYPDIGRIIDKHIRWFKNNSRDERLRNHELYGTMEGKSAFSINDDIRIIYRWKGKNIAQFLDIGGHKEVYKKAL